MVRLPSEYQEVEWVGATSNNGAYIDLGFAFDTSAVIEIGYIYQNAALQLFGAVEGRRCALTAEYTYLGDNRGTFYFNRNGTYYTGGYKHKTDIQIGEGTRIRFFQIAGQNYHSENLDTGEVVNGYLVEAATMTANLYLLGQHYNGSYRGLGLKKVTVFKYWDKNNNLICDFIPAYRKSDGVIGFYNLVDRNFLTNAGTGEFIVGADVIRYDTPALVLRRRLLLNAPHIETASGSIATFQTDMVGKLKECKIYFEPVQEGSGDPSPDNVRPITGWTGCRVERCGKNFLKLPRSVNAGNIGVDFNGWNKSKLSNDAYSAQNNYTSVSFEFINNSGVSVKKPGFANGQGLDLPCSIKGGELNYRLSYSTSGDRARLGSAWFNKDGKRIGYSTNTGVGKVVFPKSVSWCVHRFAPWDANSTTTFNNIQLELGDTSTDYEPYQGTTIPIDWTDEAGTVYGGYVDLVKGEVVATKAFLSFDGSEQWEIYANRAAILPDILNNRKGLGTTRSIYGICNVTKTNDGAMPYIIANDNRGIALQVEAKSIWGVDNVTLDWWKEVLSRNPLQIIYELATPIHYSIDPITLKTLRGTNNVFANTNGNAEVKFYTH